MWAGDSRQGRRTWGQEEGMGVAGTQDYGQRVIGVWDTSGGSYKQAAEGRAWLACTWPAEGQ